MAYDAITSGEADANSPADATLWGKVKGNFDDLDAARVTNGDSHDHSGGDGAAIPQGGIGAAAVGLGELKRAYQAVATMSTSFVYTILISHYSFAGIEAKADNANSGQGEFSSVMSSTSGAYEQVMRLGVKSSAGGQTAYVRISYMQSSPPHKVGTVTWNHFLFMLRKVGTGDIFATCFSPDPPWECNGKIWLPKDHPDRIAAVPHPFVDYQDKDPAVDGLELVLVDLTGVDVDKWIADNQKIGKCAMQDLGSVLTGKGTDKVWSDYNVPTISRFTDRVRVITP